jgi:hypothetical protein
VFDDLSSSTKGLTVEVIGVVLLVDGILVRRGVDRRWARIYRDPAWPKVVRNGPFLLIPCGLWLIAGGLIGLLPETGALGGVRLVAFIAALALLPMSVAGLLVPPRWLMPAWFRNLADGPPPTTSGELAVTTFVIVLSVMSAAAFLFVALTFRP